METIGRQVVLLRAGNYSAGTHVFAPPQATLKTAGIANVTVKAKFEVTYHDFSDEAKAAFQAAVDVWSVTLTSGVTIRVDAHWNPLDEGVLGQAGPETFMRNFPNAAQAETYYPVALANKLSGEDLTPGDPHISAEFNRNFENWYFGTDGATPVDKYDLMSVVLHELGHGLGFVGSAAVAHGKGSWGFGGSPVIYDRFIENMQGQKVIDTTLFPNPSTQLAGQLQSSRLFFNGPRARAANNNSPVQVYAPVVWEGGSSFSHLDEVAFPTGSSNSLMTPQLGMAEAIHAPGRIGLAVLRDLGW